jgi:transcriptional regulator with XRE-family HTH domain
MPRGGSRSSPHRLDVAIGQRIRERRRSLSMSQVALAEAVGLTFQQIQKYERGANRISFSRLAELAEALACQVGDLAQGLIATAPPDQLEHLNALLAKDGALQMLEDYAALPNADVRLALRHLTRALGVALSSSGSGHHPCVGREGREPAHRSPPLPSSEAAAAPRRRRVVSPASALRRSRGDRSTHRLSSGLGVSVVQARPGAATNRPRRPALASRAGR